MTPQRQKCCHMFISITIKPKQLSPTTNNIKQKIPSWTSTRQFATPTIPNPQIPLQKLSPDNHLREKVRVEERVGEIVGENFHENKTKERGTCPETLAKIGSKLAKRYTQLTIMA